VEQRLTVGLRRQRRASAGDRPRLLLSLCLALAASCRAPAAGSDEGWIDAFDGRGLDGWRAVTPWRVEDGLLVCPTSRKLQPALTSELPIEGPCEVRVELQLLGRSSEDGRGFRLQQAADVSRPAGVEVRVDSTLDRFETTVLPGRERELAETTLAEDTWFTLWCRLEPDGA